LRFHLYRWQKTSVELQLSMAFVQRHTRTAKRSFVDVVVEILWMQQLVEHLVEHAWIYSMKCEQRSEMVIYVPKRAIL
jgi:hypothetical protein